MITLKKNGTVECCCGTIYTFAEELVEKVLPILDYAIDVKFNDLHFTVLLKRQKKICATFLIFIEKKVQVKFMK